MAVIDDISVRVQDRLEEPRDGVGKFWSLQYEVRQALVEAMYEATLITGMPQVRAAAPFTVVASQTLQAMPAGAVSISKIEGPGSLAVSKTSVWDLDQMKPGWENDTGAAPTMWFPFGMTQWGVYPKLTAPAQVIITPVTIPVTPASAYLGSETVPFQAEYFDGLEEMAAHICRFKEGGPDFQQSLAEYQQYLGVMEQLSRFAFRKGELRFSRVVGATAGFTEKEKN